MLRRIANAKVRFVLRLGAIASSSALMAGCASLPTTGPTGHQIRRDSTGPDNAIGYKIIDIPSAQAASLSDGSRVSALASLASQGPVDVLGPGDVISIQVYEVGTGLFNNLGSHSSSGLGGDSDAVSSGASGNGLDLVVDRDGGITFPYVGRVSVAGLTPYEVQEKIQNGLRGKSQSPQVLVSLKKSIFSSVIVMGAVQKPGRFPLGLARDRILDIIAEAGGVSALVGSGQSTATGTGPQDMVVKLTRGDRTVVDRLDAIAPASADNLVLLPGDRLEVERQPRTFLVFGALDKISQMPFESQQLTLAEALARAGGPSDARADPRAIFVFRSSTDRTGDVHDDQQPTIYRLNLMHPSGYFAAQKFLMRDKDLIYIGNASSNLPTKFVQIINLLFSPVFSVRAATN
jgi:polysaccharide biosynthesis/export protein